MMRSARKLVALGLAAGLVAGCGGGADAGGGQDADASAVAAGGGYTLPQDAPQRFSFGTEASQARVALWDIDVKPDGEGLPDGSGSVEEGEQVYMTQCIACHGLTGTEGPYDRLVATDPWEQWPVNRGIGNYWPYATTLYDYIRRAMPQLTPGSLTADETYAVIAYLLYRNEIVAEDAIMSRETLPAVQMPARGRFVVDDRTGGPTIR
ncbi:MAG: cytochrome c [Gemmatimonadota bacterium]